MKIFSLKEFTQLCIDSEMKGQDLRFLGSIEKKYKKRHKLLKSKEVVKTVKETLLDERGIPYTKITKGTSKQVHDTNAITKIICDYLEFIYNFIEPKRKSSEGRWRADKSKPSGGVWLKGLNSGDGDIEGIIPTNGKKLVIELKTGKYEKQLDSQIKNQIRTESSNAIYYLCKWIDFETFQTEIQNLIPIE